MVPQSVKIAFNGSARTFELRIGEVVLMRLRDAVRLHRLVDRIRYAAATEARRDYSLVSPWAADDDGWYLTETEIEAAREEQEQYQREMAAHAAEDSAWEAARAEALACLRERPAQMAAHVDRVREVA
jgi:hypothetical protein